jgi:hypothetical protein
MISLNLFEARNSLFINGLDQRRKWKLVILLIVKVAMVVLSSAVAFPSQSRTNWEDFDMENTELIHRLENSFINDF